MVIRGTAASAPACASVAHQMRDGSSPGFHEAAYVRRGLGVDICGPAAS